MTVLRNILAILAVLGLNTALVAQETAQQKRPERKRAPSQAESCDRLICEVPDCILSDRVPAAYNISARIDPEGCGFDAFVNASFIYWNVSQEYMDHGFTALYNAANPPGTVDYAPNGSAVIPTSEYEPGFKVGLGFGSDFDNWQFALEYTWLHTRDTYHVGEAVVPAAGGQIIVPNEWFIGLIDDQQPQLSRTASSWKMHLDILDARLSRPFYQGRRLTVDPYVGLRALWIRQYYRLTAHQATDPTLVGVSRNRSQAWSLGPTIGAGLNWLLGAGFRFEADAGFSLLYMRYTKISHAESWPAGFSVDQIFVNGSVPERGRLRAVNELGVGFGWGSFCCEKRFHFDLSARYDFAILWQQNMMRYAVAADFAGYSNPIGDLYLHGLTFTARFDF